MVEAILGIMGRLLYLSTQSSMGSLIFTVVCVNTITVL